MAYVFNLCLSHKRLFIQKHNTHSLNFKINLRTLYKSKPLRLNPINKEYEVFNLTKDEGVSKKILKEGIGEYISEGMKVKINYEGKLEGGSVFDSSIIRNEPYTFVVGEDKVIKGWNIGIKSMKIGEIAEIRIEPEYGYKKKGIPPIVPPNSCLVFQIEVLNAELFVTYNQEKNDRKFKKITDDKIYNDKNLIKYDTEKPFIISPFGDLRNNNNILLNPLITFGIVFILMLILFYIVLITGSLHQGFDNF